MLGAQYCFDDTLNPTAEVGFFTQKGDNYGGE